MSLSLPPQSDTVKGRSRLALVYVAQGPSQAFSPSFLDVVLQYPISCFSQAPSSIPIPTYDCYVGTLSGKFQVVTLVVDFGGWRLDTGVGGPVVDLLVETSSI
ncbi:hypothetical protein FKM82_023010 [Ascaphus truei]